MCRKEGKEDGIYIAPLSTHAYSQSAQAWITQFYLQTTPCLPLLRKRLPDGTTTTEAADIQLQLTTHLSTQKYERLSWPGWLAYSGWFTHVSGHLSATGRSQDKEDRHYTVVPRNQPISYRLQLVVPVRLRERVVGLAHDSVLSGHRGAEKLLIKFSKHLLARNT